MPVAAPTPRLGDHDHPASGLYAQAFDAIKRMEVRHGLPGGPHSERLAGALVVAARHGGLQRIDHAEPSVDRTRIVAVQGELHGPFRRLVAIDTSLGASTPLERSSALAFAMPDPVLHQPPPVVAPVIAQAPAR